MSTHDTHKLSELFNELYEHELVTQLANCAEIVSFHPNEFIVKVGEDVEFIPIIAKGKVHVYSSNDSAYKEEPLFKVVAGEVCPFVLLSSLSGTGSSVCCVTATETVVYAIPTNNAIEWLSQYTSWRKWIMSSFKTMLKSSLSLNGVNKPISPTSLPK